MNRQFNKKTQINGFKNVEKISNSYLQKYNQEQEILFLTSETGKKKIKHEKRVLVKLCYQAFSLLLVEIQTGLLLLEGI